AVKRTVPAALEAVCLKAMAKEPAQRYATAKELAADVEHWLADEPVTARREPLLERLRRWGRHHRTLVSSLAVLFVCLTAGLAVGLGLINAERKRTAQARDDERQAKEDVKAALERETKLKEQAQKAEKSAAEQRQLALQTIKDVVDRIDAKLKNHPDFQGLRKELLGRAQE